MRVGLSPRRCFERCVALGESLKPVRRRSLRLRSRSRERERERRRDGERDRRRDGDRERERERRRDGERERFRRDTVSSCFSDEWIVVSDVN